MSQSLDQLFDEYEAELREEYERGRVILCEIAEEARVAYEKETAKVALEKAAKAEPDALALDEHKRLSRDAAYTASRALLDAANAYTNAAALASNLDNQEEFAALAKQANAMNRLYNKTLRAMRGIYL